ncbi:MAG: hypothetical protein QM778_16970 [Myxococcales bacterium]
MTRLNFALMVGLLLALASHAFAQGASDADYWFREGRAAHKRGDSALACEMFGRSFAVQPALGTLLNLAVCEQELGRAVEASRSFSEFLRRAAPDDDRRPFATAQRDAVNASLGALRIELAESAGGSVFIDGAEVGHNALAEPVWVEPGVHHLELRKQDTSVWSADALAVQSKLAVVRVPNAALAGALSASATTTSEHANGGGRARRRKLAVLVTGGVGAAAMIAGAVTGGLALGDKHTVHDECDAERTCSTKGARAAHNGHAFATASTAAFTVGGASLASAGLVFWLGGVREQLSHALDGFTAGVRGRF